jgi:hypothetical protein
VTDHSLSGATDQALSLHAYWSHVDDVGALVYEEW